MEPSMLLGVGLTGLSSAMDWQAGTEQEFKAAMLKKGLVRPKMAVPESVKQATGLAKNLSMQTRLPGQAGIEGRLDTTTANTIAMLERLGTGGPTSINAASRAYGNQLDAETNLGIEASRQKRQAEGDYARQLGIQGDYEQQAWNWNERMPYEDRVRAIEALTEAGIRNKRTAVNNTFGSLATLAGGGAFDKLFSGGGGGNAFTSTGGGMQIDEYVDPRLSDPSSPLFQTNFGNKPLWEGFEYGGPR